ncbi:MAG: 3-dehydroquinate synthase [Cytophagales bacterium]|nr:MAG: 3-dehydroquinate synthase [Cytophagales bacterium]
MEKNILIQPISTTLENATKSHSKIAVLVDENTKLHCYPKIKSCLQSHQVIEINSGEENKNITTCNQIWQALTDGAFDRKSLLINLGGGVIGDMGGFCAATYKRGIDFIQIPTTLLSQVDASIGGKLGIDFGRFKNHIGVFQEPIKVLIDATFLQSLPYRELRSGFAEVIKHCLIADKIAWEQLITRNLESQDWQHIIKHSTAIKSQIVAADPKEKGLRKILNFGHTVGHAVESFFLNRLEGRLLHGEAIAIGMICEAWLAVQKGFISPMALAEIESYIGKIYDHVSIREEDLKAISENAFQDKKNESGIILCSLLQEIGKANFDVAISAKEIKDSLKYYNSSMEREKQK